METAGSTHADELAFAGLRAQAALVASGDVSARELVEQSLATHRRQPARSSTPSAASATSAARAEADAADRRRAAGDAAAAARRPGRDQGRHGPRRRVDDVRLRRRRSRRARRRRGRAPAARRRRGDRRQDEHARVRPVAVHRGPGVRRDAQPVDARRTRPGGSSGGSAAAVAAGLVPAAVGSDGAGSVRIPAAWTHLVGIKPQRGRVSTWPDPDPFNGLTCIGPLARTVDDAALLLDVLAGNRARRPAPRRRRRRSRTPRRARREPGRLRIALSLQVPFSGAPATARPAGPRAVERLAAVLARPRPRRRERRPAYGLIGASFMPRSMGGIATGRAARRPTRAARPAHRGTRSRSGAAAAAARASARAIERRCGARSGGSSATSTSCSRRPPRSRRRRSARSTGSAAGRPTR